mgnify:CR=1 FL=1
MSRTAIYLVLATVAGLFAGIGDTLLNHWAKSDGRPGWIISGMLVLNVALLIFAYVLKKGTLAESTVLFILTNVVFVAIVSRFVLHEAISPGRWVCLSVAIVAVAVMELL